MSRRHRQRQRRLERESDSSPAISILESGCRKYVGVEFEQSAFDALSGSDSGIEAIEAGGRLFMGIPVNTESFNEPVSEDPDQRDWLGSLGRNLTWTAKERADTLLQIRYLARWQPNIKQAIRLYENYVLGAELKVELVPIDDEADVSDSDKSTIRTVSGLWKRFLEANRKWWTIREFGRRVWRDGDQFTHKLDGTSFPPQVRFIDPEEIADPDSTSDADIVDASSRGGGIDTQPNDITQVIRYRRIDLVTREEIEPIPADRMFHTKIDCDSTERRGCSRFLSCIKRVRQFDTWLEIELIARKLQASIVLNRKVAGSGSRASAVADNAATGYTNYPERGLSREKIRPGMILTTNKGVEYEFLTPDTNYVDASPLARQILLQVSVATGWPEYMIAGDTANGNLASTLVAEGPVVKMVTGEQNFFAAELSDVFDWVISVAMSNGLVPEYSSLESLYAKFGKSWTFPSVVTRDHLKESQSDNLGVMNMSISRAQASRNRGLNPNRMRREILEEAELLPIGNFSNQNPDPADVQDSSKSNGSAGGTNQGNKAGAITHKDAKA